MADISKSPGVTTVHKKNTNAKKNSNRNKNQNSSNDEDIHECDKHFDEYV